MYLKASARDRFIASSLTYSGKEAIAGRKTVVEYTEKNIDRIEYV